ncbi:hypothetical protein [Leucobacter massiliensis]|uniref:Uncharacterized protein n=1 Tax=Leucobacter massiliensis TaxID=1686285 RepID=A0A2S9QMX4_9MICO|nr:hypothetical protein [Leucobacter massiliensis]PRI10917.1 hypothetical protein B4915_08515 [Leucobacter massiliensis]
MAATKSKKADTAADVVEYDFDSWSEEAEEKAIASLAPVVQHIIVGKDFIGRFEDGTIVKLPLSITLDEIDELTEKTGNPVDQVKVLLEQIGGKDAVREFTRHNMTETIAMAERFFKVFARIAGASVPES